jgi:hypothetical protein
MRPCPFQGVAKIEFDGESAAESRIGRSNCLRGCLLSVAQRLNRFRRLCSDNENAEAAAMQELERSVVRGDLAPKTADSELTFSHVRVVHEDDGTLRQLREPGLEIVRDGLVRVQAVDVKKVDRSIREGADRIVERGAYESRESFVTSVVLGDTCKDLFAVVPRVLISLPRVNRVTARIESESLDGLTESEIGNAGLGSEFDHGSRARRLHDPEGKRHVRNPGRAARKMRSVENDGIDE